MAGVTRATFYRHIKSKGISVNKDEDGNPKVDVSELIRVYGSKIKPPSETEKLNSSDTSKMKEPIQNNTPTSIQIQMELLKERISNLEAEKQYLDTERLREREQLTEQIDTLKEHLSSSQDQQKRLTLLITDQREKEEGREQNETERKIDELSKLLEAQIQERLDQNGKIDVLEKRIGILKEKGNAMLKNLKRKNRILAEENNMLKNEASHGIWWKLFR